MSPTTQEMRPIDILLVEDSPSDAGLTIRALAKGRLKNQVHHVENGEEALAFLGSEDGPPDSPRPDLILLDLNLPGIHGLEVLSQLKSDDRLKTIPVIVLTASNREQDIDAAYRNMANCYITKPVSMQNFVDAVLAIETFWLSVVVLPWE